MKWLAAALLVVVVLLQYRIWLSEDGVRELRRLSERRCKLHGLDAPARRAIARTRTITSPPLP